MRVLTATFVLLACLAGVTRLWATDLEEGDLLVGYASVDDGSGGTAGGIARIRDGVAEAYCLPESPSAASPAFFNTPQDVIVDSQGRVVFLAYLGSFYFSGQNFGLFRCSHQGAVPERLAIFQTGETADEGYPIPFPGVHYETVGGLHLSRLRSLHISDGGATTLTTEDAYVLVVAESNPATGLRTALKTIRYRPLLDDWEEGPEPPVPSWLGLGTRSGLPDAFNQKGDTYFVYANNLRKVGVPLELDASGTIAGVDFSLRAVLFGGTRTLEDTITDDLKAPNIPSGCEPAPPIPNDMPFTWAFLPLSGLGEVVYDEDLGLVLTSNTGYLTPYLTEVSQALLNDDPSDDIAQYFQNPYGSCGVSPSLKYKSLLPFWDPVTGVPNVAKSLTTSSRGLIGIYGHSVVTIRESGLSPLGTVSGASTVAEYPSQVLPGAGATIVVRVDSPVDVLLTAPDGRRLGVQGGVAVNDFGVRGYDSGPGEPRFFALKDPSAGEFQLSSVGTGDGPFTIHVYSAPLDQAAVQHIRVSGVATPGNAGSHDFQLDESGGVSFVPAAGGCATDVTSAVRIVRGRYLYLPGRRITQAVQLTNVGASPIAGPLSLVADNLKYGVLTAAGNTSCAAPIAPYVNVDVGPDGQLLPGETASVVLEFTDARNVYPSYTPRALAGPGSR